MRLRELLSAREVEQSKRPELHESEEETICLPCLAIIRKSAPVRPSLPDHRRPHTPAPQLARLMSKAFDAAAVAFSVAYTIEDLISDIRDGF